MLGLAAYDPMLAVPKCDLPFRSCDSGPSLLLGRDDMAGGAEPNEPNTIHNSCADGTAGTFHVDESIDRLTVAAINGLSMAQGSIVRVSATVWVADTTQDALDLYYATNANNPPGSTSVRSCHEPRDRRLCRRCIGLDRDTFKLSGRTSARGEQVFL